MLNFVMSEGVMVALIGGASVVLAALVTLIPDFLRRRKVRRGESMLTVKFREAQQTHKHDVSVPPFPNKPITSIPSRTGLTSATLGKRRIDLTHMEIYSSIESVPPFQQDILHKSFEGAEVWWKARLSGISHLSDELLVMVNLVDGNSLMFCYAKAEDCTGLELLMEGAEVLVKGEIRRVSKYESELRNCRISRIVNPGDDQKSAAAGVDPSLGKKAKRKRSGQ